jgi:hypothetical protein
MGRIDIYPLPSLQGPPNGQIGYAEVTANQTPITTEVDITGLTVTVTVPAGRRIRISCQTVVASTITDDSVRINIMEGATQLHQIAEGQYLSNRGITLSGKVVVSPTPGTHTYKLTLQREAGTGTVTNFASTALPAFILVEDITGLTQAVSNARILRTVLDGGGSAITTGAKKVYISVPSACSIIKVRLLADVSGSIVLDLWRDSYANYPPTVADTIVAAAKPTLSSAIKSEDSTLTGWSTALAAGDILEVNVDSATTVTKVYMDLFVV